MIFNVTPIVRANDAINFLNLETAGGGQFTSNTLSQPCGRVRKTFT